MQNNNLIIITKDNPVTSQTIHSWDLSMDLFVLSAKKQNLNIKYISNLDGNFTNSLRKLGENHPDLQKLSGMPVLLLAIYQQKDFILNNVFNENQLILFIDCYDVIFNKKEEDIVKAFHSCGAQILIGAEKNGWPQENKIFENDYQFGKNRFPNSGCIIGYYSAFKKIFQENSIDSECNDQIFWGKMYSKYRKSDFIKLDYYNKIIQNDIYDYIDDTSFSSPILHANGYSNKIKKRDCLKLIYKKIYKEINHPLEEPIFLINLPHRKDRLINSLRVWGRLGIYPTVITATDHKEVSKIMYHLYPSTNLDGYYKTDSWRRTKKDKDVLSAITFSHLTAFQQAKDMNLDRVIVAQDDLMLHKDILETIRSFSGIDYDAIQFECLESSETFDINKFSRWPKQALITQDCYPNGAMLESAILHTKNSYNYFLEEHLKMQKNEIPFDVTEVLNIKRQFVTKKWYTHFPFCVLQKNDDSEQFSESNPNHLKTLKEITKSYLAESNSDYYI